MPIVRNNGWLFLFYIVSLSIGIYDESAEQSLKKVEMIEEEQKDALIHLSLSWAEKQKFSV